jgi:predicted signal transduction protein with EAL and GGDEF domain
VRELSSEDDAVRVAERVQQALLTPFLLDGKERTVTASIGIALAALRHRDAEDLLRDAEDLLRDADIAMYRAKETGPGRWEIFDERIRAEALARMGIERALREAVTAGELRLHYQPIVTLDNGSVHSVEALVR